MVCHSLFQNVRLDFDVVSLSVARTIRSFNGRVDKAIKDFQVQFTSLRSTFESRMSVDNTVQVYRIMDAVTDLSTAELFISELD